jgi:choline/glycine/proline betaine transport protein
VFFVSAAVVAAFLAAGALFADDLGGAAGALHLGVTRYLGWFYVATATAVLGFVVWLMCSRFGRVRLGPDNARPEFGTASWFAMLFTAGMGIGLVYYGVYEPVHVAADPLYGDVGADQERHVAPGSAEAGQEAMTTAFYHWGLHPWAVYIVLGLALGYLCFRKGLPLRPASALYPLIGHRVHGWAGHLVDILAVLCTIFGLATSLAIGSRQINAGLETLYGLPNTWWSQIAIVAAITAVSATSLMLGLNRGIRPLSVTTLWLAGALLALVFLAGPNTTVLTGLVTSAGHYLQHLPETALFVADPATDPAGFGFQAEWTLFYWSWWIAWCPFVGMFIARISYGRTIRQFIAGALFAPAGVSVVWFGVFGGAGVFYDRFRDAGIADAEPEQAVFVLLEHLPIGDGLVFDLAVALTIVCVVLFFSTSSDSGSLVVDMLTNGSDPHPVRWQRLAWAVAQGGVTVVLIVAAIGVEPGGPGSADPVTALQLATSATGLPFAAVLLLVCAGLVRALRSEDAVPPPPPAPGTAVPGGPGGVDDPDDGVPADRPTGSGPQNTRPSS